MVMQQQAKQGVIVGQKKKVCERKSNFKAESDKSINKVKDIFVTESPGNTGKNLVSKPETFVKIDVQSTGQFVRNINSKLDF